MKKRLLLVLILVSVVSGMASAGEVMGTTRALNTLSNMWVQNGAFGFAPFAADPFACDATTERAMYWNTVTKKIMVCDGSAPWVEAGGSSLTSPIAGDFVATGKWTFGSAADAANSIRFNETAGGIVFEVSADARELTLVAADPAASMTVTIPAIDGTLASLGGSGGTAQTFTGDLTAPTMTGTTGVWFGGSGVANSLNLGATGIVAEGAVADAVQTTLAFAEPTVSDKTVTVPDTTGTLATLGNVAQTFANNITSPNVIGSTTVQAIGTDVANGITLDSTGIVFEGSGADGNETTLAVTNPTGDRAITFPNASGTVLLSSNSLNAAWAINTGIIFGTGATTGATYWATATQTPDGPIVSLGSTANSLHIAEVGDSAYDFTNGPCGTSACTDPSLIIHSHNQATNEWIAFDHDGGRPRVLGGVGPLEIVSEGATDDAYETTLTFADTTTADKTITFPNLTGTVALLGANNGATYMHLSADTGVASGYRFGDVSNAGGSLGASATQTPDGNMLFVGATANSIHLAETGDNAYDFNNGPCGTSACTDPTLIVHSHTQGTTGWIAANHNDTSAVVDSGSGGVQVRAAGVTKAWFGPKTYTLADNTATPVLNITVPNDSACAVRIAYTATVANASDIAVHSGIAVIAAYERPGASTYACSASEIATGELEIQSAGIVSFADTVTGCTAAATTTWDPLFNSNPDLSATLTYSVIENSGCALSAP